MNREFQIQFQDIIIKKQKQNKSKQKKLPKKYTDIYFTTGKTAQN